MAAHGVRFVISILILLILSLLSCFPVEERQRIENKSLINGREVKVPTKIHILDGSVILADRGFSVRQDTIDVNGVWFGFSRRDSASGRWTIPLSDVAGLEYFEYSIPGARIAGSLLLGATVTGEVALGSLLIIKAIFGSCPTVYAVDDSGEQLEAECFSYSIGRQFELADLDRLDHLKVINGRATLRIKNEALETHYIDQLALYFVDHAPGTEVFPGEDGDVIVAGPLVPPVSAFNADGINVLKAVSSRDESAYSIDSADVRRMFEEKRKDWIDCVIPVPRNSSSATVTFRIRNSLQNTTLLYDIMMRNQGLNVLEWSKDVNESLWYAWKLSRWYKEFAGIEVLVEEDGEYIPRGRIFDTGPIAWKQTAVQIRVDPESDSLRIRLSFLPDNWLIDWIGFSFGGPEHPPLTVERAVRAQGNRPGATDDVLPSLEDDDGEYVVTYPGEHIDLTFDIPHPGPLQRTYFVGAEGYYVEWVRPEWVRERPDVPGFDLSKKEVIAQQLTEAWLSRKNNFEEQFYRDRIPTWNPGVNP